MDYTPTTEEVRNQYSGFSTSNSNHTGQVYINLAKFDRWLAEVKAEAWHEGERRGRDNERTLMMCQAQLRPSSSAVLIKNPYRQVEKIVLSNNDYDQLRKALDEE